MLAGYVLVSWWRHQMETFSALLALCVGNSPVPGEFPTQRPVTRSFDVFFDLRRLNGPVNKCKAGDLRRIRPHYDVTVMMQQRSAHFSCPNAGLLIYTDYNAHRAQFILMAGSLNCIFPNTVNQSISLVFGERQSPSVSKSATYTFVLLTILLIAITHWGRDKMAGISQTTFSNVFSWVKMFTFWLNFT